MEGNQFRDNVDYSEATLQEMSTENIDGKSGKLIRDGNGNGNGKSGSCKEVAPLLRDVVVQGCCPLFNIDAERTFPETPFVLFVDGTSWLCFPSYVVITDLKSSAALSTCVSRTQFKKKKLSTYTAIPGVRVSFDNFLAIFSPAIAIFKNINFTRHLSTIRVTYKQTTMSIGSDNIIGAEFLPTLLILLDNIESEASEMTGSSAAATSLLY
uniref:Uncharacterized protein n=1 Tax=Solanum lycopersicum TaxID=4081 RepID=A0A3Q7GPI5_SOLLC